MKYLIAFIITMFLYGPVSGQKLSFSKSLTKQSMFSVPNLTSELQFNAPKAKLAQPSLVQPSIGFRKPTNIWSRDYAKNTLSTFSKPTKGLSFSYNFYSPKKQTNQLFQQVQWAESNLVQVIKPTKQFVPRKPVALVEAITEEMEFDNTDIPSEPEVPVTTLATLDNTIYPNPTTGLFYVQLKTPVSQLKVTDLIGRVVLSQKVADKGVESVDISHLPNGSYVVGLLQENVWHSTKLVKVNE